MFFSDSRGWAGKKGRVTMAQERTVFWSRDELWGRLRRVEGQIRGIEAMIERKSDCDPILVQLAATQGALAKIVKIVEACRLAEGLTAEGNLEEQEVIRVQHLIQRLVR